MKIVLPILVLIFGVSLGLAFSSKSNDVPDEVQGQRSIYDFVVQDINGNGVKLDGYKGKVLIIVNVASKCGFTSQYEQLQKVYKKYTDQGLLILGFPANNFLHQEPGSDEEINWFEIIEERGAMKGDVVEFQVNVKVALQS